MHHKLVFSIFLFGFLSNVKGVPEDICSLDPDLGGCHAFNVRYYYNTYTGSCHEFIFGGCLGNKNNFESLDECEAYCKGLAMDKECTRKADRGPCEGYIWRYNYDQDLKECKSFVYGGCRGNSNNFRTLKECSETCAKS